MLLQNTSFKTRMIVLSAVFLLGLAVTHLMYGLMISSVRVNGPLYNRIVQDKDLTADILPPPQYIIESYLLVLQMVDEQDPALRRDQIVQFKVLENEYNTSHQDWADKLEEGTLEERTLKEKLIVESYEPAQAFYKLVKEKVIVPLESGETSEEIKTATRGVIRDEYRKHRIAIDEVVILANQQVEDEKNSVESTITSWKITQLVFGLFVIATVALISWASGRSASSGVASRPSSVPKAR